VLVNINVEEFDLTLLLLHCFEQLWLQNLAWAAPASACLDHNCARLVLNGIIKVFLGLHFFDVARSIIRTL